MFGNILKTSSFGLYIADDSLRCIELIKTKNGIAVGRYKEYILPENIIRQGEIKDPRKFYETLKSLRKEFKLKSVHFSASHEYSQYLQEYLFLLQDVGIQVASFTPHTHALARALLHGSDMGTYMFVDFGQRYVTIFTIAQGAIGSLLHPDFNGDFVRVRDTLGKHILQWHLDKDSQKADSQVKKIIISGNGINLSELANYFSTQLKNEVEVADVWMHITKGEQVPEIRLDESFNFAHPIGLALTDFSDSFSNDLA